jgi:DNA-binding NarL/FixJ family response regulator
MHRLKIIVSDPSILFRHALVTLLYQRMPYSEVIQVNDGKEFYENMVIEKPNLVITNSELPKLCGLAALFKYQSNLSCSAVKAIVYSQNPELALFRISKQLGVNAYLSQNLTFDMFYETIQQVLNTDLFICNEWYGLKSNKHKDHESEMLDNFNRISKQENKILKLYLNKFTTKEIGEILSIQTKSIDNYKNRISKKLYVPNDISFMDWVRKNENVLRVLVDMHDANNLDKLQRTQRHEPI